MNKDEYLEKLSTYIRKEIPADEYNNVMEYYSEYFADAGPDKEQDVIMELGNPEDIAKSVIAEYRGKNPSDIYVEKPRKKGIPVGLFVAVAIIGSPLWLSLLVVAICIIAVLFVVAFAVAVSSIAFMLGGAIISGVGIVTAFMSPGNGMVAVGGGFLMIAAGVILMMLTVLFIMLVGRLCNAISDRKKKGAAK
ncbi:MAG: DUF1700 domain-containing protein [Butyrivibrio sp.]